MLTIASINSAFTQTSLLLSQDSSVNSLAADSLVAASAAEDGLSFAEVVQSLPTDPASIFSILLLVVCTFLVLRYGLQQGHKADPGPNDTSSSVEPSARKR